MTALAATPTARVAEPSKLRVYRDDGPLARALGTALGGAVRLPAPVLVTIGAAPMFATIAAAGADVARPVVVALVGWLVLVAGVSTGAPEGRRVPWLVPPALRAAEYAGILWVAAVAGPSSLPAAFALLAALTFRHYDLVYRLRHQGATPPAWVGRAAAGWDGRLLAGSLLLLAGALPAAFFAAAGVLGAIFVGESVTGWLRVAREQAAGDAEPYEEQEDEGQ
jgi:Family of unknown function (DUF5941)